MRPDTLYAPGEFISRHLEFILGIAVALSSFIYLHQNCAFKSLFLGKIWVLNYVTRYKNNEIDKLYNISVIGFLFRLIKHLRVNTSKNN